jgi:hypothetical protein
VLSALGEKTSARINFAKTLLIFLMKLCPKAKAEGPKSFAKPHFDK